MFFLSNLFLHPVFSLSQWFLVFFFFLWPVFLSSVWPSLPPPSFWFLSPVMFCHFSNLISIFNPSVSLHVSCFISFLLMNFSFSHSFYDSPSPISSHQSFPSHVPSILSNRSLLQSLPSSLVLLFSVSSKLFYFFPIHNRIYDGRKNERKRI